MPAHFINSLKFRLQRPLPGIDVQLKMAPSSRPLPEFLKYDESKANHGAVLVLLYPSPDSPNKTNTVLQLRPTYKGVHSGQISFPGGKREPEDVDFIQTALREAHEEMGIIPSQVTVLGKLTEHYIPPSNFLVHPIIGYMDHVPDFKIQKEEVIKFIETDLDELSDESIIKSETLELPNGISIEAPYYDVRGYHVWGATAMIIAELLVLRKEIMENQPKPIK